MQYLGAIHRTKRSIRQAKPRSRALSLLGLFAALFLLCIGFSNLELFKAPSRWRLTTDLIEGELLDLHQSMNEPRLNPVKFSHFPDDSIQLGRWIAGELLRGESPKKLNQTIQSGFTGGGSRSERVEITLKRWTETLMHWEYFSTGVATGTVSHASILEQVRRIHYKAVGLRESSRAFDSVPLLVWQVTLLRSLLNKKPSNWNFSTRVHAEEIRHTPELLLHLGIAIQELRAVLILPDGGGTLFTHCHEQYPGSVWSERAELYIKSAASHLEIGENRS